MFYSLIFSHVSSGGEVLSLVGDNAISNPAGGTSF